MYNYNAKMIRVLDGDTVELEVDLGFKIKTQQIFRLFGLDAPEIHSKNPLEKRAGVLVAEFLFNTLHEQLLTIQTIKTEKFGRYLVSIAVEGIGSVCEMLIFKHYAKIYMGDKKKPWTDEELEAITLSLDA